MRPLAQQTVVITGATDGLGRALALALSRHGARLLLHGRDPERLQRTRSAISDQTGNEKLHLYVADFASLSDVRELAERIAQEHDRVDALVNNAGIGAITPGDGARMESHDGYEMRFAVNYLAHFLLTRSLLPLLVGSAPARIVNVSSVGQAPLDFTDVMLEHGYDGIQAYGQSKLAQIMFTFDLAEELEAHGVTVNCLHPSTYMPTKMVIGAGITPASSLEDGVAATMRLVADPHLDAVTGRYFDRSREARAHRQAYDAAARARLRYVSEELVRPH
jgi:NAD(P)-dependent dehydrogenase (short-subunit alcohol dehydrogenase family)